MRGFRGQCEGSGVIVDIRVDRGKLNGTRVSSSCIWAGGSPSSSGGFAVLWLIIVPRLRIGRANLIEVGEQDVTLELDQTLLAIIEVEHPVCTCMAWTKWSMDRSLYLMVRSVKFKKRLNFNFDKLSTYIIIGHGFFKIRHNYFDPRERNDWFE